MPPSDPDLASFLEAAGTTLSTAFHADFHFWELTEDPKQWTPVAAESSERVAAPPDGPSVRSLEKELEAHFQAALDPILLEQGDGRVLLGLPLGEAGGRRLAATATLSESSQEMTLKLARLCLDDLHLKRELNRARDDLAVCAVQIGSDFEELTFLRTLAEHLDVSDVSRGPWHVAQMVLPLLAGVVQAESLVLVSARRDPEDASRVLVDAPVCWVGPRPMSDEHCRRFVERFREAAAGQPMVQNHLDESRYAAEFPGVRKFVMTPLLKRDRVLGWLVAINHAHRPRTETEGALWNLSQYEFGTVEAGLLSSVASMLATHVSNVELVREKEALLVNVVRAMVSAIDAKDPYTCGHSERVALVSRHIARRLGLDDVKCERIYLAGLVHDLGKLGVPDAVLRKPGHLTEEEMQLIRPHPEQGWAILQDLKELSDLFPGVLHHHEQYNGAGYPDGLVGEQIPLDARILAVADSYDAMISDRPYRKGMPEAKVEEILRKGAGTQWDLQVIEAFSRALPEIKALWSAYRQQAPRRRGEPSEPETSQAAAAG